MIKNFYHYPEIFQNILIILNKITEDVDCQYRIVVANEINLDELRDLFEFYRGKLRAFYRVVNFNYLNFLFNLSECSNLENTELVNKLYSDISYDIKMFYRNSSLNNKKFSFFKEKKKKFIEIHEIITRITYKITINTENILSLLDSMFYQDIIEFILYVKDKPKIVEEVSKAIRKSPETIKKLLTSIIENSIIILSNSLNGDLDETSDRILKIVNIFILNKSFFYF